MFDEYDIVCAKVDLSQKIVKGSKGAVLMVFNSTPKEYEVEFVDEKGETLEVITVREADLEKVDGR